MFIMLDGIDGSGKSTIVETWKNYFVKNGNTVFDLKEYTKTTGRYPELPELNGYDFVLSAEPTYLDVGKVIRQELINSKNNYPTAGIAEAFAVDRLILYTKLIIPLVKRGVCVIQDRGVSTSLAYHACSRDKMTLPEIAKLAGNKLALKYRPDHLIIVDVNIKTAFARLSGRKQKKDNAIFEQATFLKKVSAKMCSPAYRAVFKKHGTRLHHLNGNAKIGIMNSEATALLKKILT